MTIRVLVVEDDALLAFDLADELTSLGYAVVGPARDVEEAMALIAGEGCDIAVLDVNLGNGMTSEAIAVELRRRSIPFAIASGYAADQYPAIFRDAPLLPKPVRLDLLVDRLHALSAAPGRPASK